MDSFKKLLNETEVIKSTFTNSRTRVEDFIKINNKLIRMKHDSLAHAGSILFDHEFREIRFTDIMKEVFNDDEITELIDSMSKNHQKDVQIMTPDGYKIYDKNGVTYIEFFEYGISISPAEYKMQKESKYESIVAEINNWSNLNNKNRLFKLKIVILNTFETDPASMLENFANAKQRSKDILFINDIFSISRQIGNILEGLKIHMNMSELDQLKSRIKTGIPENNKCVQVSLDETNINLMLDQYIHSIPNYNLNNLNSFSKSNEDIAYEIVRAFKRSNYESGFERPSKESFLKCLRENVIEPIIKDFEIKEELGPSFHLYFAHSDDNMSNGFEDIYQNWKSDLKYVEFNSESSILKDIFCCEMKGNDWSVFFNNGPVKNWQDVRKDLHKVKEPKTFAWRSLSMETKKLFFDCGVGSKKEKKLEREQNIKDRLGKGLSPKRKNETVAFWTKGIYDVVKSDGDYMMDWLMSESGVNLGIKNDFHAKMKELDKNYSEKAILKNTLLNFIYSDLLERNVALMSQHYEDVAKSVLFKSKSTNKGLHVINLKNNNVFVFTLQGLDVYRDKGETRFFTVTRKLKHIIPNFFPDNKYMFRIEGKNYIYYISKIYSFNRSRWEHFSKCDPLTSISVIIYRMLSRLIKDRRIDINPVNVDKKGLRDFINQNCKLLCLIYFSANYSGQNRMSGLLDNFRYMLPAALSNYSGLIDYVKNKFIMGLKTATQVRTFYCMKNCIINYLSESSKLTTEELQKINNDIVIEENDSMDNETIGLRIPLKQAFGNSFWDCREDAFAEIHLAFFLTAKDLYNDFHRNLDFYNSVVGGEIEYNEKIKILFKDDEENTGVLLRNWDRFNNIKRGGFFCQEAAILSGRLVNNIIKGNHIDLEMKVEQEGIYSNVMGLDFLTSTRSSLKDERNGATYTMLESCLDEVEDIDNTLSTKVNDIIEWLKNEFKKSYNDNSDIFKSLELSYKETHSGSEADISSSSGSSGSKKLTPLGVVNYEYILDDEELFSSEYDRLSDFNIFKGKLQTDEKIFDEKSADDFVRICIDYILNNNHKKIESDELSKIIDSFCIRTQAEFFERVKELENDLYCTESDLYTGRLYKLSLINLGLKNMKVMPVFKMTPKGQRTWKDREIFIENKARFTDAVLEHTIKKICEIIPEEQITRKGDYKALDTKNFQIRAFKWRSAPCNQNLKNPKKMLYFLTGDMTKWSNNDTMHRLHFMNKVFGDGIPGNLGKILRLFGRSNGVRGVKLTDKFLENPLLIKEIEKDLAKLNSVFPIVKLKQNWLQGIRNYNSTLCHYAAMSSIKFILEMMLEDDVYIDFLVHSDDFVIAIGLVQERDDNGKYKKFYEYKDKEKDYMHSLKFIDILNFICFVLKLNNNTVSVKKSSIHQLIVEFVSNSVIRGSLSMSPEKQLLSIYAETSNLGNKDDVNSLLSNSNNAISKGAATSTVDLYLWSALRRMRKYYSFNRDMRFDPIKWFKLSQDYIPLQFFPDMKISSIIHYFSSCDVQDILNFLDLEEKYNAKNLNDNEFNSLLLYCAISKVNRRENIDDEKFDTGTSYFCSFRFKLHKMDDDDILHKNCLPRISSSLYRLMDPTYDIYKSKDFVSLFIELHDRANNINIRQGLVRKTKATIIKLRGVSANEKNVRWSDELKFINVEKWFLDIQKSMDDLRLDGNRLRQVIKSLKSEIDNTFNYAIPIIKWMRNLRVGHFVERYSSYRISLTRVPGILSENATLQNSVGKLLSYEFCNPKFEYMNPYSINTHTILVEVDSIRKKTKELKLNVDDPKEKRMIVNTLDKYFKENERSKLICTRATNKKFINHEDSIRYIISNNTIENSLVNVHIPGRIEDDRNRSVSRWKYNITHLNAIYTIERFAYYNNLRLDYDIGSVSKLEFVRNAIRNVNFDKDLSSLRCAIWVEARLLRSYMLAKKYDQHKLIVKYHKQDDDFESGTHAEHKDSVVFVKYLGERYVFTFKNGLLKIHTNSSQHMIIRCVKDLDKLWKKYPIYKYSADFNLISPRLRILVSTFDIKTNKQRYQVRHGMNQNAVANVLPHDSISMSINYSVEYHFNSDGSKVLHGDRTISNVSWKNTNGDFTDLNIRFKDNCIIDLNKLLLKGNDMMNKILNAEPYVISEIPIDLFDSELSDNTQRLKNSLCKLINTHMKLNCLTELSSDQLSDTEYLSESNIEDVDDYEFDLKIDTTPDYDFESSSNTDSSFEEVEDFDFNIIVHESRQRRDYQERSPKLNNIVSVLFESYWRYRPELIMNESIVMLVVMMIDTVDDIEILLNMNSPKMKILKELLINLIDTRFDMSSKKRLKTDSNLLKIKNQISSGNSSLSRFFKEYNDEMIKCIDDKSQSD
jgi:hypothetical protein